MKNVYEYMKDILEQEKIKYDSEMLKKVINYCEDIYQELKKSNISMIDHVVGVAEQVARLKLDDTSVYASLLHGVVKCKDFNEKNFKKMFGKEIYDIIMTVDKLSCLNLRTKEKLDTENLRKMFMAIAKDIRTVIIKLADRLYNMRNIKNVDNEEVKKNMAKEGLTVYAPIAHRLGMSQIKSELEDISFRILAEEEYYLVKEQIDEKKEEREEYIQNRINEVINALKDQGIIANVYGRPKHFYSIYKKMKEKNCEADDLFDLLAIRIVVDSVKDCYSALGIIHDKYKPMPGRFKDYIAVPKTNMYQSLHTTVFGEGARPFEVQIRTWDMHKIADYGVAAHFSYKEKKNKISEADRKIVWIRQTLEIQKELSDSTENLKNMKVELFGEEVFVFTPKGDIKSLPKGSTPIDFAYTIHQKVAEKMVGAKINGRMVPLSTKLENTDVIEIITLAKSKGPNADWLKYAKTSSARNKITTFLKSQGKDENIQKGKEAFDKILRKQKVSKEILMKDEYISRMLKTSKYNSLDECYENIGFGSISPVKIVNRVVEAYEEATNKSKPAEIKVKTYNNRVKTSDLVIVDKIQNCKVQIAKCCMPIPGDEIVGYITNAKGVSVHRKDCSNLINLDILSRSIKVSWKEKVRVASTTKVRVRANNREEVLNDVLKCVRDLNVNIIEINTKVTQDREIVITMSIEITDTKELQKIVKELKKVDSVFETKRIH